MNSLGISESTEIVDADGNPIMLEEIQPGDIVKVILKNAFNEEKPFYYPTVYEIQLISNWLLKILPHNDKGKSPCAAGSL